MKQKILFIGALLLVCTVLPVFSEEEKTVQTPVETVKPTI